MRRFLNITLVFLGWVFNQHNRFRMLALSKYKTWKFKLRNPGLLYVGGEVYCNNYNNVSIGSGTYINGGSLITTNESRIYIGSDCLISYDVVIRTDMHNHNSSKKIIEQGNSARDIRIGNNVWIGHGCYIMPGVEIGDNTIIGAKAVVTDSIPKNVVAVGIPAKVIKNRD